MVWSTAVQERNFRGADVRLHSLQSALIRIAGGSCSGSTRNSKENKTQVWSTAVQERNFRGADVRLHSLQSALIRIAGGSCSGSTRNSKQNKTPLLATRALFILNRNSERRAVFLAASFELAFAAKSGEVFRSEVPVHQVPEMLDILRPCVAVIHVIGMLPHVAGQQRLVSSCQRRAGVGSVRDIHRTIRFLDLPSPA